LVPSKQKHPSEWVNFVQESAIWGVGGVRRQCRG
jgi:hypothetical protein